MPEKQPIKVRKFRVLGVSGSYVSKACRIALSPLVAATHLDRTPEDLETDDEERIKADFHHLQKVWRTRVNRLASFGWSPVQDQRDYLYAANCPPIGVRTQQRGMHACQMRSTCP